MFLATLQSWTPTLTMLGLLSVLIIAHELGHFWVARKCGIRVERFGLGLPFGPTLWSKTIGETEYCIHAALFGGYVAFPDDNPDSTIPKDSPERFENKTVWQRFAVAIAGVTVNALMGWLIMTLVILVWGIPDMQGERVSIGDVLSETSPAAIAGLKSGDVILKVGATDVATLPVKARLKTVRDTIHAAPDKPLVMVVERKVNVTATPQPAQVTTPNSAPALPQMVTTTLTPNAQGLIGVQLMLGEKVYVHEHNPLKASGKAVSFLGRFVVRNFEALGQLATGRVSAGELSGPLRLVSEGGRVIEKHGIQDGLILTAIISMILAVMNLLPIPALDGGHILFLLIEAIKGSPVSKTLQERFSQVGMLGLMALMAFILINDVNNVWLNPQAKQFAASPKTPPASK